MKSRTVEAALAIALGLGLAACGGRTELKNTTASGNPCWTDNAGSCPEFADTNQKTAIYGVGVSNDTGILQLTRKTADAAARQNLAKQLNVYVENSFKDYLNNHQDTADKLASGAKELTDDMNRELTQQTMVGAEIIRRYIDDQKQHYALARLAINTQFLEQLGQTMKASVRNRARLKTQQEADAFDKDTDDFIAKRKLNLGQ